MGNTNGTLILWGILGVELVTVAIAGNRIDIVPNTVPA
jgi:hypothetical protein